MLLQLDSALAKLNLILSDLQKSRILAYLALLHKWNAAYNLSAIKDPEQILVKHMFDCLAVVNPIHAQLINNLSTAKHAVLDVGSGAGLPGVILAICLPDVEVTMLDAVQKKMTFVRQVIGELKLSNAQAHGTRIQDWKIKYPVITARAWTALSDIPTLAGHCLEEGGIIAAMKGPRLGEEAQALQGGWVVQSVLNIQVPRLDDARTLAFIARS
jgi:16S rRNA (guanine527-N7)-methyltransferase